MEYSSVNIYKEVLLMKPVLKLYVRDGDMLGNHGGESQSHGERSRSLRRGRETEEPSNLDGSFSN